MIGRRRAIDWGCLGVGCGVLAVGVVAWWALVGLLLRLAR